MLPHIMLVFRYALRPLHLCTLIYRRFRYLPVWLYNYYPYSNKLKDYFHNLIFIRISLIGLILFRILLYPFIFNILASH